MAAVADPKAFSLRPIRINVRKNIFVNYEVTTFPGHEQEGCAMYLRWLESFGSIVEEPQYSPLGLDVLSEEGDILQTFMITRRGFEYLRRSLKFRREPVL